MNIRRVCATAAAAVIAATGLVACGGESSDKAGDDNVIQVGTTDAELPEWGVLKDLAAKEGIEVEMVSFADYATPNQSLAEGSTDTNKFQHLKYLAEYNAGNGTNLVPVASTQVYPMPLFWKDHDSIDGIEGQEIAIPNDATNQGRAINLLVSKGLLTLKDGVDPSLTPDPADIDEAKSKVSVVPVDASQTPSAYGEGKPAIILNSFFKRANIDPSTSLFTDDPEGEGVDPALQFDPYINVWAVREEDKDNADVKRLAELYLSDEVKAAVQETTGGTTIFVDKPQEELQAILDRLEEDAK